MSLSAKSLCLILAVLCAAVAVFWSPPVPAGRRFDLVAAAIGFLALSFLLPG